MLALVTSTSRTSAMKNLFNQCNCGANSSRNKNAVHLHLASICLDMLEAAAYSHKPLNSIALLLEPCAYRHSTLSQPCCVCAGCQDVQAQEVEVSDSGRGSHDQELEEPTVANLA